MLRVIIESLPNDKVEGAKVLGIMNISNMGDLNTGDTDYSVQVFSPDAPANELTADIVRKSLVKTFTVRSRQSEKGFFKLLKDICTEIVDG